MLSRLLTSFFGSSNDREVKRLQKVVNEINQKESALASLSDEEIKAKSFELKTQVENGASLDSVLADAFALVREASKRVMKMRHFDVQLIGGMVLHQGKIAEMRTGEGKTLVATLPVYLNALSGNGVHIITVNDYLAQRDANWMRPLYEFLGMSVGIVVSQQDGETKRAAYQADITYGTNNEFGFDYLRDNMVLRKEDKSQRPLNFAVVDEVDSILIDEARTPLIISGAAEDSSALYTAINKLVPKLEAQLFPGALRNNKIMASKVHLREKPADEGELVATHVALQKAEERGQDLVVVEDSKPPAVMIVPTGDFSVDEKSRHVELTEQGHQKIENMMMEAGLIGENESLYGAQNLTLLHHVQAALKAHALYTKNVEYIVQDDQVVLIDEHTGRTMPGRRLSEGLHQAIEAKEGVNINAESQTMASTTFQNYFRLYPKLSGMTGTADTEAFEFRQIYGLDVVVIPTNKPIARKDLNDLIYLSEPEKYDAIVKDVKAFVEKKAPVLVGTASVETSEAMSKRFKEAGIKHKVLNAKYHEKEAEIVAEAGRPGAVTIATNMAGRGTDIVLGGNLEAELSELKAANDSEVDALKKDWKQRQQTVMDAGGLHIIGSERHESRRIDNQLRGRAGRQGDPGLSRFYLSMDDSLMRLFASDRMRSIMKSLGMEQGEPIEAKMVTNAIEKAQRKVEGRNFDYRKQVLEYDDVANDQRQVIYDQRNQLLDAEEISNAIEGIRADVIGDMVASYVPPMSVFEQWDVQGLEKQLNDEFGLELEISKWVEEDKSLDAGALSDKVIAEADAFYQKKSERIGELMRKIEKQIMLQILDTLWKEHLQSMDHLRQGIGLRAYAQQNPKNEYKKESFELFQKLLTNLKHDVTRVLFRVEPMTREQMEEVEEKRREEQRKQAESMQANHPEANGLADKQSAPARSNTPVGAPTAPKTFVRADEKVGRNSPCPCGSGKKYKSCHGKIA